MSWNSSSRLRMPAGCVAVLAAPLFIGPYGHFLLASILIYSLVALSLGVLVSYAGQISIGHAGFFALGAYASAILTSKFGVPFVVSVLVGAALGSAFGALLALPALRVQGPYLSIATLGFSLLVQQVLFEWESLTGGRQGIFVQRPQLFGWTIDNDFSYAYVLIVAVMVAVWLLRNFANSHTGKALAALRMSAVAAQASGIDRGRHVIVAFAFSGLLAGLAGGLYAHLIGQLSADAFTLTTSLSFLAMTVIGGVGSPLGAVLGAAYVTLLPEALREFKEGQLVAYGISLIVCLRFFPNGLVGIPRQIAALKPPRERP